MGRPVDQVANVLNALSKDIQSNVNAALDKVYHRENHESANAALDPLDKLWPRRPGAARRGRLVSPRRVELRNVGVKPSDVAAGNLPAATQIRRRGVRRHWLSGHLLY